MMAFGFLLVWQTSWFERNFGDIGAMLGVYGKSWMSWKMIGVMLLIVGFLIAFGLLQLFFTATIGGLFQFGGI